MTDALLLGEKVLALLDETQRVATYKPALLLALLDRCTEEPDEDHVPVRDLAERVIGSYWRQTVTYPGTDVVLVQNAGPKVATVVQAIQAFRERHDAWHATGLVRLRGAAGWESLLDRVELTLAKEPVPRLQRPFAPFLYRCDWSADAFRKGDFVAAGRAIQLLDGAGSALASLGPLLRPFVLRWWADKAARLNAVAIDDGEALVRFETFLFGDDRESLVQFGQPLLEAQDQACFYCRCTPARVEVDHFVPWSMSGDDRVANLVAACPRCNGAKSNLLAGPRHLEALLARNATSALEQRFVALTGRWEEDRRRTLRTIRSTYLRCPAERTIWVAGEGRVPAGPHLEELRRLVAPL